MKLWLDAQLSPTMARWIAEQFQIDTMAVRDLGLRNAIDRVIFLAARQNDATVVTKDGDFVLLLEQLGVPPHVIWLRCGNTSNARLRQLLGATLPRALDLIEAGEPLVEITDSW